MSKNESDCADMHDCHMSVFDVVFGRLNVLLSFIGVALNLLIIVRMKSRKTVNTPAIIVQLHMAIMDCIYCLVPSAFLSYFHYDSNVPHMMAPYELQTCLYASGYFWYFKQFGTYFIIGLMAIEKVLLAYRGSTVVITKRSTYICMFIIDCTTLTVAALPLVAGLSYKMSRIQGLVEFTGTWNPNWFIKVTYFERLYTMLPIVLYAFITISTIKIFLRTAIGNQKASSMVRRTQTVADRSNKQHNPRAMLYLVNFIVCFAPWIVTLGANMVDLFDWRHEMLRIRFASSYLTFTSGLMLLTVQSSVNAMIYLH